MTTIQERPTDLHLNGNFQLSSVKRVSFWEADPKTGLMVETVLETHTAEGALVMARILMRDAVYFAALSLRRNPNQTINYGEVHQDIGGFDIVTAMDAIPITETSPHRKIRTEHTVYVRESDLIG